MGSPAQGLLAAAAAHGLLLRGTGICSCGEGFVTHGTVPQLRALCGLDEEGILKKAREVMAHGG